MNDRKTQQRVLPMKAAGTQHLIERVYRETGKYQWVRELFFTGSEAGVADGQKARLFDGQGPLVGGLQRDRVSRSGSLPLRWYHHEYQPLAVFPHSQQGGPASTR